jgi:hypothetical protein
MALPKMQVINKLPKVVNQTQKRTNVMYILQNRSLLHSSYLLRIRTNALCADDVPQKLCFLRSKG